MLSNGQWIGFEGKRPAALFAEYSVKIDKPGVYRLYSRKFWKHGPFQWRFDNEPWRQVDNTISLLDGVELRKFIAANWVSLGTVNLEAGAHTFRIESTTNDGAIAFDCFMLSSVPFTPRGVLKPDAPSAPAPAGWFNFEPAADEFDASPIDLRHLNEKVAGENGFIRPKGEQFIHENSGRSVRFWGVNMGPDVWAMDRADIDYLAQWLAKRGVNLVRLHGSVFKSDPPNAGEFDARKLDNLQYTIEAMKKQGIYTSLSIYFPLWINLHESDGWAGYKGQHPFALLYFDRKFQSLYRSWWEKVLASPNAYSGKPLKDEPALMYLELVNEDSFYFWTFTPYENVPAEQIKTLEQQFGKWAAKKYGSEQAALNAWKDEGQKGDVANEGRLGLVGPWRLINRRDVRSQDTNRFLFETQLGFYRDTKEWLRATVGAKQMVTASNWTTASQQYLEPLEKLSYLSTDFIDRHGYYGGVHEGERAGYSVNKGERFYSRAAVRFDGEREGSTREFWTTVFDVGHFGVPTMLSETDFFEPGRFRGELPLIAATYMAKHDMDAIAFFALNGSGWSPTTNKFALQTPVIMGQFPAAALMYRRGLVAQAPVVAEIQLNKESILNLEGAPQPSSQMLDETRRKDIPADQVETTKVEVSGVEPRAAVAGRVMIKLTDERTHVKSIDLNSFIDDRAKVIRSVDGQVRWDWGKGIVSINSPRVWAATGFLGQTEVQLGQMKLTGGQEFMSIAVVPLDDQPLATSKKMLLQVMTEQQNSGWRASKGNDNLYTIDDFGAPPMQVRQIQGLLSLGESLKITRLDLNGYVASEATLASELRLDPATIYYILER
jgi:hypothetical protein